MTGPHDRRDADELPVGTDADEAAETDLWRAMDRGDDPT